MFMNGRVRPQLLDKRVVASFARISLSAGKSVVTGGPQIFPQSRCSGTKPQLFSSNSISTLGAEHSPKSDPLPRLEFSADSATSPATFLGQSAQFWHFLAPSSRTSSRPLPQPLGSCAPVRGTLEPKVNSVSNAESVCDDKSGIRSIREQVLPNNVERRISAHSC